MTHLISPIFRFQISHLKSEIPVRSWEIGIAVSLLCLWAAVAVA